MFRYWVRLLGLVLVTGLLLNTMAAPNVLAKEFPGKNPIFQTSVLNDRFAADSGKGGDGFAKVRTVQQGSLVFDSVIAKNLLPDTVYEVHVVVSPPGPFLGPIHPGSLAVKVTTNGGGVLHAKNIALDGVGIGKYRVDIVVTQEDAPYVLGETVEPGPPFLKETAIDIDRDILLACAPAFTVTIIE